MGVIEMKPVFQTKLKTETQNGNCMIACLASILELPIDAVPAYEKFYVTEGDQPWVPWLRKFLKGWDLIQIDCDHHYEIDAYYIAGGLSPRATDENIFDHAVVYNNGKLVHDPHHSGDGILNESDFSYLLPIDFEANPCTLIGAHGYWKPFLQ